MHVKRLYRPSVREALAAAREELGPGALVLSTELVPAAGWRGWFGQRVVRLTAASERDEEAPDSGGEVSVERRERTVRRQFQAGQTRPGQPGPPHAGVVARLVGAGFDLDFAAAVAARMTESECRSRDDQVLRRYIVAELERLCSPDAEHARYEVFVGPPGVGKTTTIAKIAARNRLDGGPSLGLIAADAFRAGAVEQLQSYANIISVPLRQARGIDEFARALHGLRWNALIDTAGRPPNDASIAALFEVLARKRHVRTHLVMAADTSSRTAARLLDAYAAVTPSRVVITKIDEADTASPLLSTLQERGLPVSYLAAGQRIPDDLWRATPANLASVLLQEPEMEGRTCH